MLALRHAYEERQLTEQSGSARKNSVMVQAPADLRVEQYLTLISQPPGPEQKRFGLATVSALVIALIVVVGPLSSMGLPANPGLAAAIILSMAVIELITAMLLYAHFSILGSAAVAMLASGYLFAALLSIAWMLAFPGVFEPLGVFGSGLQTALWLRILRQIALPCFVIAYVLLKDGPRPEQMPKFSRGSVILASSAGAAILVCAVTILVVVRDELLVSVMLDPVHPSRRWSVVPALVPILVTLIALGLLWFRQRSVLDLWLMVVMSVFFITSDPTQL